LTARDYSGEKLMQSRKEAGVVFINQGFNEDDLG
jgi:hypothetical protein